MKPMSYTSGAIVVGALLLASPGWAAPKDTNRVTGVRVSSAGSEGAGGQTRVVIRTQATPRFSVFKLSAPMRVVIDLQNTDVSAVQSSGANGVVQSIRATQFGQGPAAIGRLVVTLRDGSRYDVQAEGQAVVLVASPEDDAGKTAARSPAVQPISGQPISGQPISGQPASAQHQAKQAMAPAPEAPAARRLLAVDVGRHQNTTLLKLKTDGEPLRYDVKEVVNPPRLVVDLYGVRTGLKKARRLGAGNVKRLRFGKHPDKTRVVVDLRQGMPQHSVVVSSDGLTLALSNEVAASHPVTKPAARHASARVQDVQVHAQKGFWRVSVTVDGDYHEQLASDAPRMKILEFRAQLPERLARTLDAQQLGGPLKRLSTFADPDHPGMVRLAADLRAEVEHKFWRDGDTLYWDFKTAAAPSPTVSSAAGTATQVQSATQALASAKRYKGKRITLDVKEADIINVLRLIADVSKLNIIAADNVKGKITIKLRNVPWDQALDVILQTKGLGMERKGGIIRVAPAKQLQAERELKVKQRELEQKALPTTVKLLVVNYANAAEMLPQVQKLLSKRGSATVDQRTNVIIVEDIKENLVQAERLVRTLDTQTPQVMIEARIVEASTTFTRNLGIQWGGGLDFSPANGNPTGLVFPRSIGLAGGADDTQAAVGGQPTLTNYAVNYPVAGGSALGMTFGSVGEAGTLNMRISAAESEGQAKVISAPKVVTLDNKTARISQGVDIPIMTVSAAGTQTQLITAALELEVTPHVTTDGSVLLKISVSNNVPDFGNTVLGMPSISKKEADTEVLLHDGDTSVIGGIFTRSYGEDHKYTPFIGKIPLLGWLFQSTTRKDERKELLAFITPRIVNRSKALVDVEQ